MESAFLSEQGFYHSKGVIITTIFYAFVSGAKLIVSLINKSILMMIG